MQVVVSQVSYTYPGSKSPALSNVDFSLSAGEYLAVLGANGSGKSTLARCITGLIEPETGSVRITAGGSVPSALVFQSPGDQIVAETVELDTAFGLENLGVRREKMQADVLRALNQFHLSSRIGDNTASLPTGSKQLLALAGVYVLSSAVMVLDEPTSMLSPLARDELMDHLDRHHRSGGTIIHITHDRGEVSRAGRVFVMDGGSVVFDGTPEQLFSVPEPQQESWGISARFPIKSGDYAAESVVFCRSLTEGPLENFSAEFRRGSVIAVTGESGSGKSTLLEILAELRIPESGTLEKAEDIRTALAVQESEASLFAEFVADDVAYGPRNSGLTGSPLVDRVAAAMNMVTLPFETFRDRQTFSLSGGERRKAALAGIIAMDTPVVLLDEPTSGLDVRSRAQIMNLVLELRAKGKTVIFTTNREEECGIADQVVTLNLPEKPRTPKPVKKNLNSDQRTIERLRQGESGSYSKGATVYHTLSPVGKYLCTISAVTAALAIQTFPFIMALVALEVLPVILSQYPLKKLFRGLLKILPWLILIALMQLIFTRGQGFDPVFLVRFIALFFPLSVFVRITSHTEIMYGAEDLLKPLSFIRLPVRDISLLIGIVFRFIPLLYVEAGRITAARIIRQGGLQQRRGLFHKIRSTAALFTPLVIRTLTRAERLAEAVTARYYGTAPHTRFLAWKPGWRQWSVVVFTVLISAALIYGSYRYGRVSP